MKPALQIVGGADVDLPESPFPPDLKAKGWRFELDYERIETSDTWALARDEIKPWLLMLWYKAWQQTPIGSYPNNDEVISRKIGMDADMFSGYRHILMRGWKLHDDGRLHHPVIIETVERMLNKAAKNRDAVRRFREKQRLAKLGNGDEIGCNDYVSITTPLVIHQNQNQNLKNNDLSTNHMSESGDSDVIAPPAESPKIKTPPCPYQKILELYHEILPELPSVRVLTDAREKTLRALWTHNPDLDWWKSYFEDVRGSDFLMGRTKPTNGRSKAFQADLEWLTKPGNFAKVYEGRYH